jgi:S-formylglutathione hydrolase FrmB
MLALLLLAQALARPSIPDGHGSTAMVPERASLRRATLKPETTGLAGESACPTRANGSVGQAHAADDFLEASQPAAGPPDGCRPESPRALDCERTFTALGGAAVRYFVHLPAGHSADRDRRWPVILLLHGAGRHRRTLWEHPATRAALERCKAVVVMPDGGASWWLDAHGEYPLELLDWLAPRLRFREDSGGRAVAGWSMGGFGSLRMIERNVPRFSAWGGILALPDFPNPEYPPQQNHSVPAVFGPPARWPELNPLRGVEALRGKSLWFATADEAFDRSMNETLHRRLESERIAHEFVQLKGGHTFEVVAEALPRLLAWFDRHFEEGSR